MSLGLGYYRSLTAEGLLLLAREQGINADVAVALAEKLAEHSPKFRYSGGNSAGGTYRFNQGE